MRSAHAALPTPRPLRVALDARVHGEHGGVQQTIIGLANGLSALADGDEEYEFLAFDDGSEWLRAHLGGRCRLLPATAALAQAPRGFRRMARLLAHVPAVRRGIERGALGRLVRIEVPHSDGTIERAGIDVMHFTVQAGFWTKVPSIYVPHDLQHLHYPEFFSPFERRWRAVNYGPLAHQARAVIALSRWGKDDIVRNLGIAAGKVYVIGWASALDAFPEPGPADLALARRRLRLPDRFALYPAQTWRHKNHVRLREALASLREREGLVVPAVFSGRKNDFFPEIERAVRRLRLGGQVSFTGYVTAMELRCLYRLAEFLVFPSEFEGFGMPVVEAFRAGLAVACSRATSLPELAGDAALTFAPTSVADIAAAVRRLATDPPLRARLVERGRRRAEAMTWREVARRYRALYRLVAGRAIGPEDVALLDAQMLSGTPAIPPV